MSRRRRLGAAFLAFVALAVGAAALRLEVDNRLERWAGDDAELEARYAELLRDFGSDEFVFVSVEGDGLLEAATLERLLDVVEACEALPQVRRVQGVPTVYRDLFGAEDAELLADEVRSSPFFRDLFVSSDARTLGLLVHVGTMETARARRELVTALDTALAPLERSGLEVRRVGSTVLGATLDEVSEQEARRTFPLAMLGSLVVLGLLLRSWRALVSVAACALLAVVATLGLVALCGRTLNMVSSALPPLLWVLALANIVHIVHRLRMQPPELESGEAVSRALTETTRPCVLAAVTTAAGFASLVTSPMLPVREFGAFAAAGILLSLGINLAIGPVLFESLGIRGAGARVVRARAIEQVGRLALARPWTVVCVTMIATGLALLSLRHIRVESNPLQFLPREHTTVADYAAVGRSIGGFYTMEVVVDGPAPWHTPPTAAVLDALGERIEAAAIVSRVVSPLDLLKQARRWQKDLAEGSYRLPSSSDEATALVESIEGPARQALDELARADASRVRLSALVAEMAEGRFLSLVTETESALAELPAGFSGFVTGQVLRLVRAQQSLVSAQLSSLAVALVLVFVCVGVGLRSWRLTLLSLFPNVLPVLSVFALMSLLGWPLDPATVMVASIALGIAVDNTAHVLAHVRATQAVDSSWRRAAVTAVGRVAPAMLVTTLTACIGFLSLWHSAFVPIGAFGVLASTAMVVALFGDLVLLPATIGIGSRR